MILPSGIEAARDDVVDLADSIALEMLSAYETYDGAAGYFIGALGEHGYGSIPPLEERDIGYLLETIKPVVISYAASLKDAHFKLWRKHLMLVNW